MFIVLPLAVWVVIFFLVLKKVKGIREASVGATVLWAVTLVLITECLSAARAIAVIPLAVVWFLALVFFSFFYFNEHRTCATKRSAKSAVRVDPEEARPSADEGSHLGKIFPARTEPADTEALSLFSKIQFSGIVVILGLTALAAWISSPNNYDSMTYHLARVVHWIQNRSVAYYPTWILRQLHHNPFAEFVVLHLQILSGGDRLANLVQWFSFLGVLAVASLLAAELGGGKRVQVFAAFCCATVPMAILQASSTQNDLVVSFFFLGFIYYGICFTRRENSFFLIPGAMSLGLAILTKATAYLFALPFLIWFGVVICRRLKFRAVYWLALSGLIVVVINSGHYLRNLGLYGSLFGFLGDGRIRSNNEVMTVTALVSNGLRNMALNFITPCESFNRTLELGIGRIHEWFHWDASDPRTTFPAFYLPRTWNFEDTAGNFFHTIIIAVGGVIFLLRKNIRKGPVNWFLACLVSSFFIFCLVLKWQPWHCRLLLPLAVLGCVFLSLVFCSFRARHAEAIIFLVLFASSFAWSLGNHTRPIFGKKSILFKGRTEQYFACSPNFQDYYEDLARFLKAGHYRNVGLAFEGNDWEYPLWVLLGQAAGGPVRLEHIDVDNISGKISRDAFYPDAVVCSFDFAANHKTQMQRYLREFGRARPVGRFFVLVHAAR